MPVLAILQYPDPRLGKVATSVTEFGDEKLQSTIDDMFDTLHNAENCAGLAATQLDIKDPPRITVIYDYRNLERKNEENEKPDSLCLVNPEIIVREGESFEPEGCMSVPGGVYEPVKRSAYVKVKAFDRSGKVFEIEGEGYMSKLLQHEIDHLNGKIFIDHLSQLKRQRIDKKLLKIKRQSES